ncbi:putative glutathione peroxidase [Fragilariopsis cylindrus CCMP1102]|nr:putative glutathione peroxidase [Fragilariopsis cylindrus CCMP1102]|eukprot:OEU17063.1 putative glutathione peroxidase [Fragilariopsis cylindrus CCMP1102]
MTSFYSLTAVTSDGSIKKMEDFRGKVVYATNYAQFASLHERWGGDKLSILGFPSREFGWQEFEKDEEIQEFAKSKNFPGILMKLGKIKGDEAPEVWKFFKDETGASDPMWNFRGKFLVSKNGEVSVPTDLEADIERLMEEDIKEVIKEVIKE